MSKGDVSFVGQVLGRWEDLSESFASAKLPHLDAIEKALLRRRGIQTSDIHWAARALQSFDPEASLTFNSVGGQAVFRFLGKYNTGDSIGPILKQYLDFRTRSGSFDSARSDLWPNSHNPKVF